MVKFSARKLSLSLGHLFLLSNLVVGLAGFYYLHWAEERNQIKISVPSRDLVAYARIKPTDLVEKAVPRRIISPEIIKEENKIRDRYTLVAIPKDKPISKKQLGPEFTVEQKNLLQNAVLIAVPATPAMTLAGSLQAGDRIDIMIVQDSSEKQSNSKSIQFKDIFVFDIKLNSTNPAATNSSSEAVVVLAIPASRQAEFSRSLSGSKVILTRKL